MRSFLANILRGMMRGTKGLQRADQRESHPGDPLGADPYRQFHVDVLAPGHGKPKACGGRRAEGASGPVRDHVLLKRDGR